LNKFLLTAALLMLTTPVNAVITVCGPATGNGCELPNAQSIFFNEIHDSNRVTGNVGPNNRGPLIVISARASGAFGGLLDAGSGFGTLNAALGFNAFNGVDITIPGFTFTDMVFEVQMTRRGGERGDAETDPFDIWPLLNNLAVGPAFHEAASPDAAFQFNVLATDGDRLDELVLVDEDPSRSGGFFEIKHLQVSGLVADVPEPSTWVMLIAGFGFIGALGLKRRSALLGLLIVSPVLSDTAPPPPGWSDPKTLHTVPSTSIMATAWDPDGNPAALKVDKEGRVIAHCE